MLAPSNPATAQTVSEPEAGLSEAEERFDHRRRTVGLMLGPFAFAVLWVWPVLDLSVEANRLLAIVGLVVIWWVTEAIPIAVTALVGTALTVVCGIASATDAFAPFASPTIFLFMGSFMIGKAIAEHHLDRRLAVGLLALPMVAGNVRRMRVALGGLTLVASAWISNTATTAMMVPVALGILDTVRQRSGHRGVSVTTGFLLTIAYSSSIGGLITPVGSPPNLITLGLLEQLAGVRISFLSWMLLMAPIAIVYGICLFFMSDRLFPTPAMPAVRTAVRAHGGASPALTRGQRNCAIAFAMAVALWLLPGALTITGISRSTAASALMARLDEGVVAILAAGLLFVLPVDWRRRRFTLDWSAASEIDWGTILLFGGGLSLGRLMFTTGLAGHVGTGIVRFSGAESLWAVTAVATLVAILLTEITSNTAATSMLVPVVLSICTAAGLNPVPPALGVCLGASLAFMLPISTPPNAIVYGTGLIPIRSMIAYGIAMDVIGFILVITGLRVMCPLLGFA